MTEATPKTISLQPTHWQVLATSQAAQLAQALQSFQGLPNAETLSGFDQHVAMLRTFVVAWVKSVPKDVAQQPQQATEQAQPGADAQPVGNGAEPKRRGGWPKGKKRSPKDQTAQAVQ